MDFFSLDKQSKNILPVSHMGHELREDNLEEKKKLRVEGKDYVETKTLADEVDYISGLMSRLRFNGCVI